MEGSIRGCSKSLTQGIHCEKGEEHTLSRSPRSYRWVLGRLGMTTSHPVAFRLRLVEAYTLAGRSPRGGWRQLGYLASAHLQIVLKSTIYTSLANTISPTLRDHPWTQYFAPKNLVQIRNYSRHGFHQTRAVAGKGVTTSSRGTHACSSHMAVSLCLEHPRASQNTLPV